MNWIKIVLRTGKDFSFPDYKVLAILESEEQLVRVHNKKGEWTGATINKADISYTEYDGDRTRQWNEKHGLKLPEPEADELSQEEIRGRLRDLGQSMHV